MIQAMLKMDFAPGKINEAVNILRSIVERIRATKGCISCSVFQEAGNEYSIVFEEKWQCDADLQSHLQSEEYKSVLMVIEMANKNPEIRFEKISEMGGVEIIREARSQDRKRR